VLDGLRGEDSIAELCRREGLMMAPKTGEVLADMLSGHPVNADLAPLSAHRFL
jgi:glycine/D-amino acid oxidase-like deaminating enzyme